MRSVASIDEAFMETIDSLGTEYGYLYYLLIFFLIVGLSIFIILFLVLHDELNSKSRNQIFKTQIGSISEFESSTSNSAKVCRPIIEGIERSIRQVILRVYIHHKFYPALDENGSSFFVIYIEGLLLDEKLRKIGKAVKFSNFFDKVEVQVDKKATASNQALVYSWRRDKSGFEVDGIKIKVYAEKLSLCRIALFRRNILTSRNRFVRFRYCEISPKLRQILPSLRPDPSEDEVLIAVWQYITDRDLFGDKDHKVVRCDELLKGIFQADSFFVSYLRGKLAPHILGEKPVLVDHYLDPQNTESFLNPPNDDEDRPASSASSRTSLLQQLGRGGASRVLDLEVDLAENDMHSTTRLVKELRNREAQSDENVAKLKKRLAYILRALQEKILLVSRSPLPLSPALAAETLSAGAITKEQPLHYTPRYLFDLLTFRRPAEHKVLEEAQQLRKKRMGDLDTWSAEDAVEKDVAEMVVPGEGEEEEEEKERNSQQDLKRKREEREAKRAPLSSAMERGRQMQLVQWSQLQSDPPNKTSALAGDRELSSSLSLSRGGGSAVHVFDGFLDVGEDSLFSASDPAPWMQASFISAASKPLPPPPQAAPITAASTTAELGASDGSGSIP